MPLYNWFKIQETGNLTYIRKEPKKKFEYNSQLQEIWFAVHDEYLMQFGLSDEFMKVLKLKQKQIRLLCDYMSGNIFAKTEADIVQQQLEEIYAEFPEVSNGETVIMIESALNFKLNPKEITVLEYFNYIKFVSKQSKAA